MFERGAHILCAVSGGADSTALLLTLCELASAMDLTLEAAHVNHRLRGTESDYDEAFVRALCHRLTFRFFRQPHGRGGTRKTHGTGIEACAREVRYSFFRDLMERTA